MNLYSEQYGFRNKQSNIDAATKFIYDAPYLMVTMNSWTLAKHLIQLIMKYH